MIAGWLIFEMNFVDWVLFSLSTAIIFGILGRRLLADMRAWKKGRASARAVDGSEG